MNTNANTDTIPHQKTIATATTNATGNGRLGYLPIALFGSVMGLTGLSIAWRLAQAQFGAPEWIAQVIGLVALSAFIAQATGYAIKTITDFGRVRAEFTHPLTGNLFGTLMISLLLLPLLIADVNLMLARIVWSIGAIAMTLLAWIIVTRWISVRQHPAHATPVWILPVVGMIDMPLAVPSLGWSEPLHGVMMFALAIGLFFTIPIFTMILSRLMFEEPIPDAAQPSLLILVGPFAVGFSAYVTTIGRIDAFAEALYMLTLFMLAVIFGRIRRLGRCPFRVSWWSVSFPLAASATAALRYAGHAHNGAANAIAVVVLGIATISICALAVRTLVGIGRGELAALSH